MDIDKSKIDVSQAFLLFMATVGDVEKTASFLDLDVAVIEALAKQEGWLEKIRRISIMSKGEKPGDYERAQNRALNYVQAHLFRRTIDQALRAVRDLSNEEVLTKMTSTDRNGKTHVTARFYADMAAAMEKVQGMTYAALGDSTAERKDLLKDNQGNAVGAAGIHAAVIAAMNGTEVADGAASELLDADMQDVTKQLSDGIVPK